MSKYQKRPVTVEARQWDGTEASADEIADWVNASDEPALILIVDRRAEETTISMSILTLEGRMEVSPGDWVIQGVEGEFYPCKPGIFEKTYIEAPYPEILEGEEARTHPRETSCFR